MDWKVTQIQLAHPVWGTFSISFYPDPERFAYATALRCFGRGRQIATEFIGGSIGSEPARFASIADAKSACLARIRELDDGAPVVCSALSDGYRCEQLEAR